MHRRRTALCLVLAVLPACGLIADIQPLTVAYQAADDADAGAGAAVDAAIPLDAPPDAICSEKTTPMRLPSATDQTDDPTTHSSWTGTDAIKFDDDAGATAGGLFPYARQLLASGFGFDIPPSARVLGVTVLVRLTESGGTWVDNGVTLQPPGDGGKALSQAPSYSAEAYELRTYGDRDELWGRTLDPSVVNQASFGVGFQTKHGVEQTSVSVDYIKMQVTYLSCE